jgi:ATP-dependent DNA ligase
MSAIIFPPRPKSAIPPHQLPRYEKTSLWVVQYKYNGSRMVIHIEPGDKVSVWSRHGDAHRSYTLPSDVRDQILLLPGLDKSLEYWLDAELLIKTSAEDTKGKIILFDILQAGKYLFMMEQMSRLILLDEICGKPRVLDNWRGMGYGVSEDILMAPTFTQDFLDRFKDSKGDEVEGLVLRKKSSVLDNFGQKKYEVGWIVRCRREHKNYNF